ncbi:MAG: hypothetical protein DDG59_07690 [Anaerolineae bacterium]|jgi:hypothetical protein|nr:MAG: hypothetical protein DDG59_07690 [Anaerolineae bacterium]
MSRSQVGVLCLIIWLTLSAAYPYQLGGEKLEWNGLLTYRFGESLTLAGKILSQAAPKELNLILQSGSQTIVQPLSFDEQGNFEVQHDLREMPLRPFARVDYWLEGVFEDGTPFTTEKKEFLYEDNRFPWKSRAQASFRVHWRQGDLQFAQTALNVAKEAQIALTKLLPVEEDRLIEIYIYETPGELRQAIQKPNHSWVGAHADPDLGVLLISVSQGMDQRLQMEQQIPHEMAHIYLYRFQPNAYAYLPIWLQEGLASAVEIYPNPDYFTLLETAWQNQSLLSLQNLCQTFPQEAAQAYLAYAQSAAIVQYLIDQYGIEKLRQLIETYAEQVDCEVGVYRTYGLSLAQLEGEWQKVRFGETHSSQALANLAPWAMLFVFVLFGPLILSWRLLSHSPSKKEEHL